MKQTLKRTLAVLLAAMGLLLALGGCAPKASPAEDFGYNLMHYLMPDGTYRDLYFINAYRGSDLHVVVPDEIDGHPIGGISHEAFARQPIESVVLPDSVQVIFMRAFLNCTELKTVTFGNQLEVIEGEAFDSCTSLTELTFPKSLRYLSYGSFAQTDGLKTVTFTGDLPQYSITGAIYSDRNRGKKLTTVYYPKNNQTWTEEALKKMERDFHVKGK